MGYDNVLFNGKSMRNAIITKLSEDKHLTSALFANSNVTILIDIISYMYQCLLSNLRQAASESMWSDTIFFENATRLAKLIGYYAKGQTPYTMLAKLSSENNSLTNLSAPTFGNVTFTYGPYEYNFAVVEHNVNNDQTLIRLALGEWKEYPDKIISDGTPFQEFIIKRNIANLDEPVFISQKYIKVYTRKNDNEPFEEWTYSPDPLFLIQNDDYRDLNAENPNYSRTEEVNLPNKPIDSINKRTRLFNFYINENGDYILKFGDGLSTDIPTNGSKIFIYYIESIETDKTITPAIKTAISNASAGDIYYSNFEGWTNESENKKSEIKCTPFTILGGYKNKDNANSIRINSRNAFSRQNRLVTKEDYKTFILENYPEYKDVAVQNNWEYISSFYGWLYAINKDLINSNDMERFNSSDLADANNIYIWVLDESVLDINNVNLPSTGIGIIQDMKTGTSTTKFGNSIGAIKDITVQPIFLNALCKRFMPYANNSTNILNYNTPDPFQKDKQYKSFFRIHIDSNYSNNLNVIKAKTFNYIKSYLFDNIALGVTPNIPSLIKDLMSIDGIINITTVFNDSDDIATEKEVNGMQFCTWTDTGTELIKNVSDDAHIAFNLPNIPCFQYFKAVQPFNEFINKSIEFKVDYSICGI